jgi:hypothetical protein
VFLLIVALIVILQILIITFGGKFFQLYRYQGLNIIQWVISVGIALLAIPTSIILRLLPFWKPDED